MWSKIWRLKITATQLTLLRSEIQLRLARQVHSYSDKARSLKIHVSGKFWRVEIEHQSGHGGRQLLEWKINQNTGARLKVTAKLSANK